MAKRRSYNELKQVIDANIEPYEFQRGIAASLHEIERLREALRAADFDMKNLAQWGDSHPARRRIESALDTDAHW